MAHLTAVHTDLSPLPRFSYAARAMAMRDTLCLVWTSDYVRHLNQECWWMPNPNILLDTYTVENVILPPNSLEFGMGQTTLLSP